MKIRGLFWCLSLGVLFILGCRREIERPQWQADILAPLATSSLSIHDLVADSTYQLDTDSSIILVFQQPLDSFSMKGIDSFQIDPFYKKIKLSSLKLNTDTITQYITLGQIARQMLLAPDQNTRIIGAVILLSQGKPIDSIPSFENISAQAVPLDITEWFKIAVIKSGKINVRIQNELPVSVSHIQFELNNQNLEPKQILATEFFNITPGSVVEKQEVLDGKKIEGNLSFAIADLDLMGGKNIIIDTNSYLKLQVAISDILLEEATAIFPTQDVARDTVEIPIGMVAGVEAKEAILQSGVVRIKVLSTIQDTLYYVYKIPNAVTPSGEPFQFSGKVNPSKNGEATNYEYISDFSGYKFDLRGKPGKDTVNTFYSDFVASIKYSGKPVFLSLLNDSLIVQITLERLTPQYLRGYIAQDTTIEVTSKLDLFERINAQMIDFEKIKVKLDVKNGFGIAAKITPKLLKSINANNQEVLLDDPSIVGVTREIPAATDKPFKPSSITLSTSQAAALLNNIPNRVSYQLQLQSGNTDPSASKTYNDFVYNYSSLAPSLTVEAPLNLAAKGITLRDTVKLSSGFKDQIKQGNFTLLLKNGFPLKMLLTIKFVDEQKNIRVLLPSVQPITEAALDATTQKVTAKVATKLVYNLSVEQMQQIAASNKMVFEVRLDTQPENTRIKLYDSYSLDIKVIGDLTYQVQ